MWEIEKIFKDVDVQDRSMTWQTLGNEVGLDVCWRMIQREIERLDYYKCVTCRKGWVNKKLREQRKA